MPISFKKKPQQESIWTKEDPTKPFEKCTDITKLPGEVLTALENEGYDEEDTDKVYKVIVDGYTYRFSFWNGDWQCSRWAVSQKKPGTFGSKSSSSGPREWSFTKMVDFEFGNLNQLHDIATNQELEDDETWELIPFVVMNAKNEPHGVMKKMKRIAMVGSEEKTNSNSGNSKESKE